MSRECECVSGGRGHSCLACESFESCHFEEPWRREIRREASSRENRGILKISPGACPERVPRFLASLGMTGEGVEMTLLAVFQRSLLDKGGD